MDPTKRFILPRKSAIKRHEIKLIFVIAFAWTIIDFFLFALRLATQGVPVKYSETGPNSTEAILLRELNVFLISVIIGYFLVALLRNFLRSYPLWINFLGKTVVLVLFAIVMNFVILFSYHTLLEGRAASKIIDEFFHKTLGFDWLIKKMPEWILLFLLTLLALEVNEKYSRGVFFNIMLGRYLQPKDEDRIIMFIDLKNSTPIAEKLGHKDYFKFIRDVIYCISAGIVQYEGRIYQYVGDEVVVWWPSSKKNAQKCIKSILEARKILNANLELFKRRYGLMPEYRTGIHTGEVTVGQIGIVKKDVVMSGDTINTASRIRTACGELNQKYLASKEMIELLDMEEWQSESMGLIDLKGKEKDIELFALKI
jgi:adenylate cyclase